MVSIEAKLGLKSSGKKRVSIEMVSSNIWSRLNMPVIVDEEAEMVDLWGNKLMIVEIPWEMTQNTISSQMLD